MGKPAATYPEKVADQIGSKLDHLAQNPKGLQVKELVARLQPKIEAAQESGYTLEDIVGVFKAEGVSITLNTLKQYLREIRAFAPDSDTSKLPASSSRAKKAKAETSPKALPQPNTETAKPDTTSEDKPKATNTDERGFQRMRSDDEL